MFKKLVFGAFIALSSCSTLAGIIEYNGYSRNTANNIVSGGGLDWLMWDATKGMSISDALSRYSSEGWRLATDINMSSLFDSFQFGRSDWRTDENSGIVEWSHWSIYEESPHNLFLRLFGRTFTSSCDSEYDWSCYKIDDKYEYTYARYGNDNDRDGLYRNAFVLDDYTLAITHIQFYSYMHEAGLTMDYDDANTRSNSVGIALVRDTTTIQPKPVPMPSSLGLVLLGLFGLGYSYRQTIRCWMSSNYY